MQRYKEAIDDKIKAIKLLKNLGWLLYKYYKECGNIYYKWEKYKEAIDYYTKGIKIIGSNIMTITRGQEPDPYVKHWSSMQLLTDFQMLHVQEMAKAIGPTLSSALS